MSAGVSVVIAVRDRSDCVADAVASAAAQDPAPAEILVVDDGSTDGSGDVAASAPGSPRVIRLARSLGPSGARNAAIREAKGEWLAFLDSDDLWLPGSLAARLGAAGSAADLVLVSANAEAWDGVRVVKKRMLEGVEPETALEPLAKLLAGNFVLTSTALARRDAVLDAGGFAEDLSRCEDYDLWLRLARTGRFAFVDRVLARYRVGPERLSSDADRMLLAEERVLRRAIAAAAPPLPPELRRLAHERIARLWLDAGYADLVGHRAVAARGKLVHALAGPGTRSRALLYLAATLVPTPLRDRIRAGRGRTP